MVTPMLKGGALGLAAIVALSGETFKLELLDVTSSATHAIALVRATAQRQDKFLDARQAHVFEIIGGRIVSIWSYAYDRYAIDEFWNDMVWLKFLDKSYGCGPWYHD